MTAVDPPDPFDPLEEPIVEGMRLHRVHHVKYRGNEFNPGRSGAPTASARFSYFGDPRVPVLYAGMSEEVAVCESLLHDKPLKGGVLLADEYQNRVMSTIITRRPLTLIQLHGASLLRLGVVAGQVTDTPASQYGTTVKWAEAGHRQGGFDGIVWMSRKLNSERAVVLFGDRVAEKDLVVQSDETRIFRSPKDQDWLEEFCHTVKVKVMRPPRR